MIEPAQIRAARGYLGISQYDLANACKLSQATITRTETSESKNPETIKIIKDYLSSQGIIFTHNGISHQYTDMDE